MANITTYLENKFLEHSLGVTAYTKPTSTYAALFTASPTIAGGGTEVTGTGYTRQLITWGAAAAGQIANTAALTWTATGSWSSGSSITSIGIFDTSTSGNLLYFGPLSASLVMTTSDTFTIPVGSLIIKIN